MDSCTLTVTRVIAIAVSRIPGIHHLVGMSLGWLFKEDSKRGFPSSKLTIWPAQRKTATVSHHPASLGWPEPQGPQGPQVPQSLNHKVLDDPGQDTRKPSSGGRQGPKHTAAILPVEYSSWQVATTLQQQSYNLVLYIYIFVWLCLKIGYP